MQHGRIILVDNDGHDDDCDYDHEHDYDDDPAIGTGSMGHMESHIVSNVQNIHNEKQGLNTTGVLSPVHELLSKMAF